MGRKRISSSRRPPTDNNDQDNGNFAIDKSASMRAMSSFDDARVGSEDECKFRVLREG